jgi:hypothetical protein
MAIPDHVLVRNAGPLWDEATPYGEILMRPGGSI